MDSQRLRTTVVSPEPIRAYLRSHISLCQAASVKHPRRGRQDLQRREPPAWRIGEAAPRNAGHPITSGCCQPSRHFRRPPISTERAQSWAYSEDFLTEDDSLLAARRRAAEFGCGAVSVGTGSALRMLAAGVQAEAVVEIGTGAGVSGLWLLGGMRPTGVLTTIDVESAYQQAARNEFLAAGIPSARTRLIAGRALDVLPRMADGAYDLVFVDADPLEAAEYVEQALRMLRRGGLVAVAHALWHDKVADPARRDDVTVTMRELGRTMRSHDELITALLPIGDGLLTAVKK